MTDAQPVPDNDDGGAGARLGDLIPIWQFTLCVVIGLIGLIGLADAVAPWRGWFDAAWMTGWRDLAATVFAPIAGLLPDGVVGPLLGYILLGAAVARVFLAGALAFPANLPEREGKDLDPIGVVAAGAALAMVWPVVWLHVLWSFSRGGNVHHRRSFGNRYFSMRRQYTDDGRRSRRATGALIGRFTLITGALFALLLLAAAELPFGEA